MASLAAGEEIENEEKEKMKKYVFVFAAMVAALIVGALAAPDGLVVADAPASLPDLTVTVSVLPAAPEPGEEVEVTVRVTNQGQISARDFCSYLYIDPVDSPPVEATSWTYENCLHANLAAGASYSWAKGGITFTQGLHTLWAWVDRDGTVGESDEGNNMFGPLEIAVGTEPATWTISGDHKVVHILAEPESAASWTMWIDLGHGAATYIFPDWECGAGSCTTAIEWRSGWHGFQPGDSGIDLVVQSPHWRTEDGWVRPVFRVMLPIVMNNH